MDLDQFKYEIAGAIAQVYRFARAGKEAEFPPLPDDFGARQISVTEDRSGKYRGEFDYPEGPVTCIHIDLGKHIGARPDLEKAIHEAVCNAINLRLYQHGRPIAAWPHEYAAQEGGPAHTISTYCGSRQDMLEGLSKQKGFLRNLTGRAQSLNTLFAGEFLSYEDREAYRSRGMARQSA